MPSMNQVTPSSLDRSASYDHDRPGPSNQDSAEMRLALASDKHHVFSAPLRPLAYDPANWENADQTRPSTPNPATFDDDAEDLDIWRSTLEVVPGMRDDPIDKEIVDVVTAHYLVDL